MVTNKYLTSSLVVLDALLDTIVFGRPLGFFGENLETEKKEVKPEVKPTPAPTHSCEGQPRDKNGRFCKVEVKVENPTKVEVRVAQPKPETKSDYSIIGKRMKIDSDDYTYTKSGADGYIAGKPLTILSEPYVDNEISEEVEVVNVMSEETGREYVCEFRETWLI